MRKLVLIILLVVFFSISFSIRAANCNVYVSVNGNDDISKEQNSKSNPFLTFQKAADTAEPGDVICFREGTYKGVKLDNVQGTSDNYIVFKTYAGEKVTILPYTDGSNRRYGIHIYGRCRYLEFDGFEITDNDPLIDQLRLLNLNNPSDVDELRTYLGEMSRLGVRINRPSDYESEQHHDIIFRNLEIHHILGVAVDGFGHNLSFIDNHIYDNGWPRSGYAFYTRGDNNIYRGNIMHDNAAAGFHIYGKPTNNNLFENNIIYNNRGTYFHMSSDRVKDGGVAVYLYASGGNNIVRNNIIYNNELTGVKMKKGNNNLIINNTIVGSGFRGVDARTGLNAQVINNIIFGNTIDVYLEEGNSESNNLIGIDPLFFDSDNADYHIMEDSPAKDAGVSNSQMSSFDFEGTVRDNKPDIGADEYGGGGAPPSDEIDINCDDLVDVIDLGILLSYWNTNGTSYSSSCDTSPDIDSSSLVDNTDIEELLNNWYN